MGKWLVDQCSGGASLRCQQANESAAETRTQFLNDFSVNKHWQENLYRSQWFQWIGTDRPIRADS